jgi:hypothetical protein
MSEYEELIGEEQWNDPNPEKLWTTHNFREFSDRAMRCALFSGQPHFAVVGVMHEMYRIAWLDNATLRGSPEQIARRIGPQQVCKTLKPLIEAVLGYDGWHAIEDGYQHAGLHSALSETLVRVEKGKRRAQRAANARWHKASLRNIEGT